jgi:glycosyltransferase involved in cell wall biosynthesis
MVKADHTCDDRALPVVTVILPAFNAGKYLAASLAGLMSQQVVATLDVVLVDNGSTDATREIAASTTGVRVLEQPIRGSYAARNLGIRNSSGEFVVFLDPDCVPRSGWLSAALTTLRDSSVQIVLGKRIYGDSPPLQLISAYEDEKIQWILEQGATKNIYGYTNNMAVRRSIFDQFGHFPEWMRGGDTLFVQRVVSALGPMVVRYNGEMAVEHRELMSLDAYYHKRSIYGESNEHVSAESSFRPLTNAQRFAVFASVLRRHRMSPFTAIRLFALLVPGAWRYERSRRRAS